MEARASREQAAAGNGRALDWLNFLLADVQGGFGPFLAIYLMSSQHWKPGPIGIVLTIAGAATVAAQVPAGALVDAARFKRTLIALAAGIVAAAAITMALAPQFWTVAISQAASGAADAVFPLAVTAISLGIAGREAFPGRNGRNQAWNHAGNVVTAIVSGAAGSLASPVAVLWIIAALAAASAAAAFRIASRDIDHDLARGDNEGAAKAPGGLKYVLGNRKLLLFTASITLFHFANAAMLPLAGERLSQGHPQSSMLFMSACIIIAQAVMVPMAILVGRRADAWGRKPLFLLGFAVLPVRGLLFGVANDPYFILAIQMLDGVGAGIFGALFSIVVADFTKGSGHFNLAQGVSSASWGLGAAFSNGAAGLIVDSLGFRTAFLFLAACAGAAFAVYWFLVPESHGFQREEEEGGRPGLAKAGGQP